jgi:cobalt/nickel transport system permease protein
MALPFCLFAGISNFFFERETAFKLWNFSVSYGLLSCFTLVFRTMLCVSAALSLGALTPFPRLSAQLRRFRVPAIFVTVLEMMYRYLGVLAEEGRTMLTAYELRSPAGPGRPGTRRAVAMKHMGSFAGSLFLRASFRAERIYAAMKCRLYSQEGPHSPGRAAKDRLLRPDFVFLGIFIFCCALFRCVDIPLVLGRLALGELW